MTTAPVFLAWAINAKHRAQWRGGEIRTQIIIYQWMGLATVNRIAD
jgi:hypothetical protein